MSDRVIGGYALRRVLGRGGMGEVHLATTPTGGLAAVKVIHPGLARDPAFRRRFEREVAAARRVARFCTAPVLDAGIDDDVAYLVTEYVRGADLAQAVREQGPLSGGNLEALAVGIATALSAIHAAGVIHRDLKPSNVLLSPLGPRVIDFGIAQLIGSDTSQAILGTPAFMAPEQARGEAVGPFTDVFAWGGVIAFAGTGRPPFGGGSPAEVLYRVTNEGPRLDGLDGGIRGLVEQALAKSAAARPPVSRLLAELLGGSQITPASATEVVERTWTTPLTGPSSGENPAPPGSATTWGRDEPGIPPGDMEGYGGPHRPDGPPGSGLAAPGSPSGGGLASPGGADGSGTPDPGGPRDSGRAVSDGRRGSGPADSGGARGTSAASYGGEAIAPEMRGRDQPGVPWDGNGGTATPYGGRTGRPGAGVSRGEPDGGGFAVRSGAAAHEQGDAGVPGTSRSKRKRWWVVGGVLAVAVAGTGVAVGVALLGPGSWPYESDFADAWEVGASEAGTAGRDGSGYVLAVEEGWRLWKSAPRREPGGGVVVSAKARLEDGAGEYGVWCHGSAGDRYEFVVSGAGEVAIVKRRAGQQGVMLYGPVKTQTADLNRVVAECAGDAGKVALRMWLNERLVAEAADAESPFGPGLAGVHAAPRAGKTVRVRFESFALRPAQD